MFVLDFDGVLLKNDHVYKLMNTKSTKFLANELNIPINKAKMLQQKYLHKLGHTSLILSNINKTPQHLCLKKYNDYVFNDTSMYEMLYHINNHDINYIHEFHDLKVHENYEYILFSNAHLEWIDAVLSCANLSTDDMFDHCFTSDNNYFKPNHESYDTISNRFDNNDFIFIDDNLNNLKQIKHAWNTYHFTSNDKPSLLKTIKV